MVGFLAGHPPYCGCVGLLSMGTGQREEGKSVKKRLSLENLVHEPKITIIPRGATGSGSHAIITTTGTVRPIILG
jgi:hypothetical protein